MNPALFCTTTEPADVPETPDGPAPIGCLYCGTPECLCLGYMPPYRPDGHICTECEQTCARCMTNLGCPGESEWASACCGAPVLSRDEYTVRVLEEAKAVIVLGHLSHGDSFDKALADVTVERIDRALAWRA